MITPNLVETAKDYYNCKDMVSFPLNPKKRYDDPYCINWDKKLVGNEIMADFTYEPRYSVFTMTLLEDSGWY